MGKFEMNDYVDVAERIRDFREKYPEGTLQAEVVDLPEAFAASFIAVRAYAYRTPDDQRPGVGLAYEPVPGATQFTKNSELQNAETSAWGRAIVAVGASDTKRGIASANEVRNRQDDAAAAPRPAAAPAQASEAQIVTILDRLRAVMVDGEYPEAWREARVDEGPTTYRLESLEQMVTGDKPRCSPASAARMTEVLDQLEPAF